MAVVKQYLTTADDDKNDQVKHYGPQASTAVVFKIENERTNERAERFRKRANRIVKEYPIASDYQAPD